MNMNIIANSGAGGRSTAEAHPFNERPTPIRISASPSHNDGRRQPAPRGTVAERSGPPGGTYGLGGSMVPVRRTSCRSAVWAPPSRRYDSTTAPLRRPDPLQRHVGQLIVANRTSCEAWYGSSSPWRGQRGTSGLRPSYLALDQP